MEIDFVSIIRKSHMAGTASIKADFVLNLFCGKICDPGNAVGALHQNL